MKTVKEYEEWFYECSYGNDNTNPLLHKTWPRAARRMYGIKPA
jgi:hypothetical protein